MVAAQIVVELEKLQNGRRSSNEPGVEARQATSSDEAPVVIGGSILDVHYRVTDEANLEVSQIHLQTTWKGKLNNKVQNFFVKT